MLINPYAVTASGGGGVGGGVPFSDVALLLHLDANFADSSSNAITMSTHSLSIDTTSGDAKFGAGCADFGNYGGWMATSSIGSGDALDLSTTDYTVELWSNSLASVNGAYLVRNTFAGLEIADNGASGLHGLCDNTAISGPSGGLYTPGSYHHVALVVQGTTATLYIDGVGGTPITVSRLTWVGTTLAFGGSPQVGADFNGRQDEIRVTRMAVYTANFTPPATAFPDS